MKTKVSYVCELCGASYDTEKDALKCESQHIRPKKIVDPNYNHGYSSRTKYPEYLYIDFEDNARLRYRLD